MSNFKFNNGDMVTFTYGGVSGVGKIVGIAGHEQPFFGATWMVELPEIVSDVYPFTVLPIPAIYLKEVEAK